MTKQSRIDKGLFWDRAWSLVEGCTPVSPGCDSVYDPQPGIGLVIAGPESGPRARPCDPAWIRSLREQCQAAGVPFFDKSKEPLARELPWAVRP